MAESKHKKTKFKSFKDIPVSTPISPERHPANNLAARGAVPLGNSGAQMMSPMDANLNQSQSPDIPGGGNTGMIG